MPFSKFFGYRCPAPQLVVMNMEIPKEEDWGNWNDDLDTRYAFKQFGGKSISEAVDLFIENALYYQEDLQWMPIIPFQYYIHAYKEYLLSDKSSDDSDAASCYLRLIKCKLGTDRNCIIDIFDSLLPSINFVADNQAFYDADISIYGNFKDLYSEILDIYNKYKNS